MESLRHTFGHLHARVAAIVLAFVLILAVFGGVLAPADPLGQSDLLFAPAGTAGNPLGTDYVGRDVLSRLMAGAGASVGIAVAMVLVGLALGAIPGVLSAVVRRGPELALVRTSDALMTLPPIVFSIAIAGLFTDGPLGAIVAIGVLLAPRFFRVTRAEALGFTHQQYVEAATLLGASRAWILRRHVVRKVLPTIAVTTADAMGIAVLATASLSFLGLGVQAPEPTWGGMLAANVEHLAEDPWAPVWPGLLIAMTVWSLNTLADALRDGVVVRSRIGSDGPHRDAAAAAGPDRGHRARPLADVGP